jgi:hypothetical protein
VRECLPGENAFYPFGWIEALKFGRDCKRYDAILRQVAKRAGKSGRTYREKRNCRNQCASGRVL